jgi:hypothetical protein
MASPIKYIVVTPPRSGTGYTAEVLSRLGLNCGHEKAFSPGHYAYHRAEKLWGDASWLAVPFLDKMPKGTLILHQTRDPIKTLDSMSGRRQLRGNTKPGGQGPRGEYTKFLNVHFDNWESDESQSERLARFWVEWNSKIEQQESNPNLRYFRFKLEDMNEELLLHIVSLIGAPTPTPDQLQAALYTDIRTNHKAGRHNRKVPWAEEFLRADTEIAKRVRSLGKKYGY